MIDFYRKIKNSNKFRKPALTFIETGSYCSYPKGTTEYYAFWDKEMEYCINGYTADDGDYITGYNYFYLNYCPIQRIVYKEITNKQGKVELKRTREQAFPDFYDYDYYYFLAIEQASQEGKHLCVAKARRKGYSYKGGSMLCRNFFLIPGSKSYVYASNKQYLTDDGILTKAWDYMDFVDEHTAWGKKRQVANTSMRRRASMLVTDEFGNKIEVGYKSEIIGVSLKDNPDAVRGKAGMLILWEEAGTFAELAQAWQIARPSVEQDGVAFGLMIMFGTGGDQGDAVASLRSAFYDPKSFNCIGFENIWDEAAQGKPCGFFIPQHTNLDIRDEHGKRLYMDEDGNTLHEQSRKFILDLRDEELKNAKSSQDVDRYVAEHSETPAEAFTELTGNIFPKKELQKQLSRIRTNKKLQNHKQVGDLLWVNGELNWIPKKNGDILNYPLPKTADPTGSIVIWEHPVKDAPVGLYIAGCLTPGEKVMTDEGLLSVEDVTLENKLINQEGDLVNINTLLRYKKCEEDIYKVKVSNTFRTTTFTQEHPIYISKHVLNKDKTISEKNFNFNYVRMRNVKVGDWIKVPNVYRKVKEYKNPICDNDYFWWFVGLWLGDGWCDNKGNISVSFNKNEFFYIEKFRWFVAEILNIKNAHSRIRNGSEEITFKHLELANYLTDNFGKYAYGKNLPEFVKYLDDKSKLQLIRGYLNSDGCITINKKYYSTEFVSINLSLLEGIQDILFSLGIVSNLSKLRDVSTHTFDADRICKTKECYHLRIGHNETISLYKHLYPIPALDSDHKLDKIDLEFLPKVRKKPKNGCFLSDDLQYIYFQIKNITKKTYTGTVYNFDCETHTFLCHHITTHNCDPYDHDQAGTNSLGATFIYKRIQNFESYHDIIVAEYTGRPKTAEEYYENVRKLLMYYNARLMYENERKGLFAYFTNKHCDYLLADQPDIISDIVSNSKVQRRKGCHMSKEIKLWGEGKIKEWLEEELSPGEPRLTTILSEPFLEELIQYNDKGNFDRVMAFMQIMIYREQLYNVQVKQKVETEKRRTLFDRPLFTNNQINYRVSDTIFSGFGNTTTYTFTN